MKKVPKSCFMDLKEVIKPPDFNQQNVTDAKNNLAQVFKTKVIDLALLEKYLFGNGYMISQRLTQKQLERVLAEKLKLSGP